MKNILRVLALVLVFSLLFCSCGTQIVASEIIIEVDEDGNEYYPDDNSSEDDASSEDEVTSSEKDEVSSKEENVSSKEDDVASDSDDDDDDDNDDWEDDEQEKGFDYTPYVKTQSKNGNSVMVYKEVSGFKAETAYKVEVKVVGGESWIEVPVYYAEVKRAGVSGNEKTYFASIDLDGTADVRVIPKNAYKAVEVMPESDGIPVTKSSGKVSLRVSKACQLSVKFDDNKLNNLQLFVNDMEDEIPDINDSNVIFMAPGVHNENNSSYIKRDSKYDNFPCIELDSNQTLYIAGGAVVNAQIVLKPGARNVKICGRGIINLLDFNSDSGTQEDTVAKCGAYPCGVRMANRAYSVEIDGIIVRNSCSYAIMGNAVLGCEIDNVKLFSRGQFSDGIDMVASMDIKIKNSYIRTNDDGIAIYGSRWGVQGSAGNWDISNIVFNMDCAHAVNIGTHGSQKAGARDEISYITFKDIDILDVYERSSSYWGAMAFTVCDENYVHHITFEDIRMYGLSSSCPFYVKVKIDKGFSDFAGYKISDITFKNVTLYGSNYAKDYKNKSEIAGYASDRVVDGVTFENLKICGTKVTSSNSSTYFNIGKNAKNITFK